MKYSYKYRLFVLVAGIMSLMTAAAQVASGNTFSNSLHGKVTAPVILKAVKLVYFQDFPLQKKQNNSTVSGCFSALSVLPVFGFFVTPVLRCKEKISLLRPDVTIEHWKKLQKKNGFVDFNLTEFGINHVEAKIISVKPAPSGILGLKYGGKSINAVTGVFKRHSMDVGQYKFKTEGIKNVSTINVTNSHRFYVKNKHGFISIGKVQSTDSLLTDDGRQVKLLCADKRQAGCGTPYHPENPVRVYNIEIDQRHTYFVGHDSILAHNPCPPEPNTTFIERYYDKNGEKIRYKGYMNIFTHEFQGEGFEYNRIESRMIYIGLWNEGKRHGWGTSYDNFGVEIYEGYWYEGLYHGEGTKFQARDIKEYHGSHVHGVREGEGTLFNELGHRIFFGTFKDGKPMGHGIEYNDDGYKTFEGEFRDGKRHGYGRLFDQYGWFIDDGYWEYGVRKNLEPIYPEESIKEEQGGNLWPALNPYAN